MTALDWQDLCCISVVIVAGVGVVWWSWHGGQWW